MKSRIEVLPKKLLVGKSMRMSLSNNRTSDLWKAFITQKSLIENKIEPNLYSIQVYDSQMYFEKFNPNTEFTKWAAIEVQNYDNIPFGFDLFAMKSGLYAVFLHKGPSNEFPKTMQLIFGQWLPNSEYDLDNRPHFEVLGANYKNNDPSSEEEVWIPIRKKA